MRISDWSSDVCSSDLGDGGPGHIARLVGSEHYIGRREFLGLRRSPERRVLAELLHLVWRQDGRNERGPDRPGCNAVHTDFLLAEQLRQPAGEVLDRALVRGRGT